MEETLVNFEIALLAKEKGFDYPCNSFYLEKEDNTYDLHKIHYARTNKELHLLEKTQLRGLDGKQHPIAPTQSHLQQWLRNVHNIHITITSISQESWQWHLQKPKDRLGDRYDEDYYTYEAAMSDALQVALESI